MRRKRCARKLTTLLASFMMALFAMPVVAQAGDNDWSRFDSTTYHCIEDTEWKTWNERQLTEDYQTLIIDPGVTLHILYGISTTKSFHVYGGGTLIVGESLRNNNNMIGFAGIGGDPERPNSGHITIGSDDHDGTTVIAYGSPGGAGIGGGEAGSAGGIDIKGDSKVFAYGGIDAAGIGGGRNGSSSYINNSIYNINFYDCDVHATGGCTWGGGDQPSSHNAPGIGSGNDLLGNGIRYSNIYIYRGTVVAEGAGDDAAAIGGGKNCDEGRVTIYGGKVTAEGTIGNARSVRSGNRHVQLDPTGTNLEMTTDDYITAEGYCDGVFVGPVYRSSLMNKETGEIFAGEYAQDNPGLINATLITVRPFVTFDSNGGSDVAGQAVVEGECAAQPEDPTREGYIFNGWCLDNQPFDFATPIQENTTLVARWLPINPQVPVFKNVSLTVGQQIGLTFWLDLPEAEYLDYSNTHLGFSIDDKAAREKDVPLAEAEKDDKGFYGFTFDVTSIEMAEPVTATFHYNYAGEERTISVSYSVQDYFNAFDVQADTYSEKTVNLVHATADLGYYMYPYLSRTNGWTPGDDYAQITKRYATYGDADLTAAAKGLKGYGTEADLGSSGVTASASASFDSLTAVNVFLSAPAGTDLSAEATYGNKPFEAEKLPDGRWLVRVEGVRPQHLNETVTVNGSCSGKPFSVKVSVLGLLNLGYANADNLTKAAFASAYFDWQAAKALG